MSLHNSKNLLHKITFPPPERKQLNCPPISSPFSKKLLAEFRKVSKTANKSKFILTQDENNVPNPGGLLEKAINVMKEENWDLALDILKEAIGMGISTPEIYRLTGETYQRKDAPERALEMFNQSIALDPLNSSVYLSRADCYLAMNEPGKSSDEFEKYMKLELPSFEILVKAGRAGVSAGRLQRAEELLYQALQLNGSDPYVYYTFGELYEKLGNSEKAVENYSKVIGLDAHFADPYIEEAEAYLQEGELHLALELFQSVLKILPKSAQLYMKCAEIYVSLGFEFADCAISCITNAIENYSVTDSSAVKNANDLMERMHLRKGELEFRHFHDIDAAITDFTLCLSYNPNHVPAREYRATCFRQRNLPGDLSHAKEDYEVFIHLSGVPLAQKSFPHVFLGEYYFQQQNYPMACEHFTQAWLSGLEYNFDIQKIAICMISVYLNRYAALTAESSLGASIAAPAAVQAHGKSPRAAGGGGGGGGAVSPTAMLPSGRVAPLQNLVFQAYYSSLKEREPTAHTELEYTFKDTWEAHLVQLEKQKEEEITQRFGKRPPSKTKKRL